MAHSASHGSDGKSVVDEQLYDDHGDPIGPRSHLIDHGLATSTDGVLRALSLLEPEELARVLTNRVAIEQARGVLMFVYRISADDAFELLELRAQQANVELSRLSEHLLTDLVTTSHGWHASLRSMCDDVLMTIVERVNADLQDI